MKCEAFEFATNDSLGNTWTSEWDLVCDKEYLKIVAETFFLLGVATGGIVSGILSDKFGRKRMLFISAVLQSIFGELFMMPMRDSDESSIINNDNSTTSSLLNNLFPGLALFFVKSFEVYVVMRALLGVVSVSVTYAGLILAIEYVDGVWRTLAGMYNLFPLPISYILISGIAFLTQDHRYLQLCIGMPGVFLCLLWYVLYKL